MQFIVSADKTKNLLESVESNFQNQLESRPRNLVHSFSAEYVSCVYLATTYHIIVQNMPMERARPAYMYNVAMPIIKVVIALTISVDQGPVRKNTIRKSKMSGL